MLYGVSLAYKESSNCRLEANYAHQQELDMIPLMMTQGTRLPLLLLFTSGLMRLFDGQVTPRRAGSVSSLAHGSGMLSGTLIRMMTRRSSIVLMR